MIRASIENPYGVFVGVVILVIFSLIAYFNIPVQLKPTIEPLEIHVTTRYFGASALEVEDQISNKLEKELASLNDLRLITSNSQEGNSEISMLFADKADREKALLDVVQAVQRVTDIPELATDPQIELVTGGNQDAIIIYSVDGEASLNEKYDALDQDVVPALLRVKGVGRVQYFGGDERQIIIQPDNQLMSDFGVSISELSAVLALENRDVRGGALDEGEREFIVRTLGKYKSLDDVRNTVIRYGPQGSVIVGDVAQVFDGRARSMGYVKVNGKRSVVMMVQRQSGANTVSTIHAVQREMEAYNRQFEKQGIGMHISEAHSQLGYIDESMTLVKHDLLIGAVLAALALALFLRAGRPILIAVTSIPISLISVFLVLQALDRSINIIALAGLSFASGLVVDDAIVALENIDRHMRDFGKPPRQAALEGLQEVWGAIFSSTLTRIAVFIPIILNVTEAGLLFKDIAIAVVTSITVSLLATLTVVPSLAALIMRTESTRERIARDNPKLSAFLDVFELQWLGRWFERLYHNFLDWACSGRGKGTTLWRLGLLAVVFALFLGSLVLLPSASYLPRGTQGFIFCVAQPVVGQRNEVTSGIFTSIEQAALADPRIDTVFSVSANPFFTAIGVSLKEGANTDRNLAEMSAKLTQLGFMQPGFQYFFAMTPSIFQTSDKEFTLEVVGPELNELKRIADQLQAQLLARPDIVAPGYSVRSGYTEGVPELGIKLDRYRAAELGLSVSDVALVVESMISGRQVSTFTEGGREYDLVVRGDQKALGSRDRLAAMLISARNGQLVRLDEVASIEEGTGPTAVRHFNRQRSIQLTVNTLTEIPTQTALDKTQAEIVEPMLANLPAGYNVRFGEAADKLRDTFRSLIFQGLLAVAIIYLLMVALFRSFYYPIIILITVPLAWSGSFLAISIAYALSFGIVQFDVLGMLGLIILSGIVVANAILIIHQMLNFQHAGMEPIKALHTSALSRLRPIMMTVLVAVFGMLPLALGRGSGSELYRSLGIVVVGGLSVSTLFTLFVVPTMLSLIEETRQRMLARRAKS